MLTHKTAVLASSLFLINASWSAPSLLSSEITPQGGLWSIDEENNGEPGRGFQLDVQNDIMVLTFYGYAGNGTADWWLAAGSFRSRSNKVKMDMGAYEGGSAFGGPFENATYLGSDGEMEISFDSPVSGEICLPDESCKSISPMNFGWGEGAQALIGTWHAVGTESDGTLIAYELIFDDRAKSSKPDVIDTVNGKAKWVVGSSSYQSSFTCEKLVEPDPWQYECSLQAGMEPLQLGLSVSRDGLTGSFGDDSSLFSSDAVGLTGFRVVSTSGRPLLPN